MVVLRRLSDGSVDSLGNKLLATDESQLQEYYPIKAGSGSTLTDEFETNDATITNPVWTFNNPLNTPALDMTAADAKFEASGTAGNRNGCTIAFWFTPEDPGEQRDVMQFGGSDGSTPTDGWRMEYTSFFDAFRTLHYENGSVTTANAEVGPDFGTLQFHVWSFDSDNVTVYRFLQDQEAGDSGASDTAARGTDFSKNMIVGTAGGQSHLPMTFHWMRIYRDTLTQSQAQLLWEKTRPK